MKVSQLLFMSMAPLLLLGGCASGPSLVAASSIPFLPPGLRANAQWTPSQQELTGALRRVEAAFSSAASSRGSVPEPWAAYTVIYWGLESEGSRVIRMQGQCRGIDMIITGGGGACVFYTSYDVQQDAVLDFGFGGNR